MPPEPVQNAVVQYLALVWEHGEIKITQKLNFFIKNIKKNPDFGAQQICFSPHTCRAEANILVWSGEKNYAKRDTRFWRVPDIGYPLPTARPVTWISGRMLAELWP